MTITINRVALLGYAEAEPEAQHSDEQGGAQLVFRLATSNRDRQPGQPKADDSERHRLIARGAHATLIAQYLTAGARLYIEGHLQTHSWEDPATNQTHTTTAVIVDQVLVLRGGQPGASVSDAAAVRDAGSGG